MNAPASRSTRRWLWVLFVAAVLVWTGVLLRIREREAVSVLNQWLDHAREHGVSPTISIDCEIPGLKTNSLALQLFGEFRVHVDAKFDDDALKILDLPDCPVPLIISAWRHIPEEHVARLRQRFGPQNVHP